MRIIRLTEGISIPSKIPHLLIAGVSGYGKGNLGESVATKQHLVGWKVYDINSESRGEGMCYGIPNNDWDMKVKLETMSTGVLKPSGYDSEIIMFLGNKIEDITSLPKNVRVCVFNEEWLTNDDLKSFLSFNENQSNLMDGIFEIFGDRQMKLSQLYNFLKKAGNKESAEAYALKSTGGHYASVNTIKRRARSLLKSGLFYNGKNDIGKYFHYLDLEEINSHADIITTFSTYMQNDRYIRYVCIATLLKKFVEFLDKRKSSIPICFYIREGNDFYEDKSPPPYMLDIQKYISLILRKGRSFGGAKIMVIMDTQYLDDLPDSVFKGFNKIFIFRLPINDSKKLMAKATIPIIYLENMARADVGIGMYISNGTFNYPIYVPPTLHLKADPSFDVFKHLSNLYGTDSFKKSDFIALKIGGESESILNLEDYNGD